MICIEERITPTEEGVVSTEEGVVPIEEKIIVAEVRKVIAGVCIIDAELMGFFTQPTGFTFDELLIIRKKSH